MKENILSEDFNRIQHIPEEYKEKAIYEKRYKPYTPDQMIFIDFNPAISFPKDTYERFIVNTMQEIDIEDEAANKDLPEDFKKPSVLKKFRKYYNCILIYVLVCLDLYNNYT